jgi:cytochrome P450
VRTAHPTDGTIRDNLLDPELIQDPYPYFAQLREQAPVHYSEFHRSWLITRYHDVAAGLGDLRLSSDRVKPLLARLSAADRAKAGGVFELMADWMVVSDQPAHTRLRTLATLAFHPRTIQAMRPRILEIVDTSIDAFIESGETDIVAGFSFPLPATVISELIGAPAEDAHRFKEWSDDLALVAFGAGGDARGDRHARSEQSIIDMFGYFGELIDQRREAPGQDMISALLAGDEGGERLDDDEIRSMCALMLFAGHETTTTTITSAIKLLLDHRDQLARMQADPAAVGTTVEEVLRYEGASRVLLIPAAANRDPRRFRDPDVFDIRRKPNPHLAFGKGIHACIGAMLARFEMRIALQRLFERLPDMQLAGQDEPQWMPSLASRGLSSLHVELNVTN